MEKVNLEYISIIGHEMRTPLTSIRGYLSMILEGDMGDISPEARKALNHCYDSSVRLIKLVNDVLVLSKIENGKMEYYPSKIEITEFLKSVYNDIFIEAEEKKIDVKIEIDKN
ncbi:HAMP domain-containing histidine kinase, partial [Candidatus Gracilibacteria bacterium]|nr:HAMP domain-containing histidine kinase [Candidatus Gracilibacteria bacterium]